MEILFAKECERSKLTNWRRMIVGIQGATIGPYELFNWCRNDDTGDKASQMGKLFW